MTVCGEAGRTVFSNSRWHGGIAVVVLGVLPITASSASSAVAASCESLATLSQANTTITSAQSVGAGEFMPPGPSESPAAAYGKLPAFCRVAATLRPSSDSDIKIEVWLPVSGWNGKLQSVGNGGWAGFISYPALALGLADGYATKRSRRAPAFRHGDRRLIVIC